MKPKKTLPLNEVRKHIPKMYATQAAKHFGVSYATIRTIAKKLNLSFKPYKPKGRKPIQLV